MGNVLDSVIINSVQNYSMSKTPTDTRPSSLHGKSVAWGGGVGGGIASSPLPEIICSLTNQTLTCLVFETIPDTDKMFVDYLC